MLPLSGPGPCQAYMAPELRPALRPGREWSAPPRPHQSPRACHNDWTMFTKVFSFGLPNIETGHSAGLNFTALRAD